MLSGPKIKTIIFKSLLIGVILIISSAVFLQKEKKNSLSHFLSNFFIDSKKAILIENREFVFVEKNTLRGFLPPYFVNPKVLGTLVATPETEREKTIKEYIVEPGDTISSLATKFNISKNTILWANNLNEKSVLKPGQKLLILPVSGVLHIVKEGDTLSEIARKYKAKMEEIITFNELSNEYDIYIGDFLIIPNGQLPQPEKKSSSNQTSKFVISLPKSYFVCPIPLPCQITQGLHGLSYGQEAVDFSHGKCGEPVYAAASGKVIKAKYCNWCGGTGNSVSILHPSGIITVYYHLQEIFVSPGQEVLKGEQIGTIGRTGLATGCHLHFGVIGAQNPFAK
jgi:murein DD-endopeptidase MepM/ murein hydrolase activator NlpD